MALTKTILIAVAAAVIAAVGAFYTGYTFNPYFATPIETEGLSADFRQFYGVIESHTENALVIKLINGDEHTIMLTAETAVVSAVVDENHDALQPGEPVLLSGTETPDGVVADYITLMGDVEGQ